MSLEHPKRSTENERNYQDGINIYKQKSTVFLWINLEFKFAKKCFNMPFAIIIFLKCQMPKNNFNNIFSKKIKLYWETVKKKLNKSRTNAKVSIISKLI